MSVDEPCVFDSQDAGVVQSGHDPDFPLNVVQTLSIGDVATVGDLQRNASIFDHVLGSEDRRKTTLSKASQDAIFVQTTADSKCGSIVVTRENLQRGGHRHLV